MVSMSKLTKHELTKLKKWVDHPSFWEGVIFAKPVIFFYGICAIITTFLCVGNPKLMDLFVILGATFIVIYFTVYEILETRACDGCPPTSEGCFWGPP
jgi:hypothetical protein